MAGFITASDKLGAVTDYLEKCLGERVYWECSSDLINTVDIYISATDGWRELRIPMNDIEFENAALNLSTEQVIENFLSHVSF